MEMLTQLKPPNLAVDSSGVITRPGSNLHFTPYNIITCNVHMTLCTIVDRAIPGHVSLTAVLSIAQCSAAKYHLRALGDRT